ncbi:MAG: hypothetical protein AB2L18_09605 [Anaerolineaceae bacterium]
MTDALVTFFTTPKSFTDPHINIIQRNAIQSWKSLGEQVEIFLIGNDEGVAQAASDLQVLHFPQVRCNDQGTPLISSMLQIARENSCSPYLCIINTDILVLPEMLDVLKVVAGKMQQFLLVGQRWDVEITELLPQNESLFTVIREKIQKIGRLHPPMGSDYFLFPRTCFTKIPDFAIGRAGWDNWMIYKARLEGWKVIDGSQSTTIAHQDHDYRHFKDGKPHYRQPETRVNVKLAGGAQTIFTLYDAQCRIVDGQVKPIALTWKRFWREMEIFPTSILKSQFLGKMSFYLFHPQKAYAMLRNSMKKVLKGK